MKSERKCAADNVKRCQICGKEINRGANARFCPECARERIREQNRGYMKKHRLKQQLPQVSAKGETTKKCLWCGKFFVIENSRLKRCETCRKLHRLPKWLTRKRYAPKVKIEAGWRGQRVMGGGALNGRHKIW